MLVFRTAGLENFFIQNELLSKCLHGGNLTDVRLAAGSLSSVGSNATAGGEQQSGNTERENGGEFFHKMRV